MSARFTQKVSALVVVAAVVACATPYKSLPEPPPDRTLCRAVKCEAHIVEPYRYVSSRSFHGRVLVAGDPDKLTFPGARLAFRRAGESAIHQILADKNGRFDMRSLPPGVYEFAAWATGMDPDRGWLTITPRAAQNEVVLYLCYGV
jgi:hypothetical protein